jgi:lactoylglutathione lyase
MLMIDRELIAERAEPLAAAIAANESGVEGLHSLRIAVASSSGERVDRHFGQTDDLWIFDVTAAGNIQIDVRNVDANALGEEDRRQTIYRLVADCKVLLIAKIGVTPQENLASMGVEGIDKHANAPIDTALRNVFCAKTNCPAEIDTSSFRMQRVVLQVTDLDRSLDFYTRLLGMEILDRHEHKKHHTVQFCLGYGQNSTGMVLEIVHRSRDAVKPADRCALGHIVIGVTGISTLCDILAAEGVCIPRPPRSGDKTIALIEDPDGHRIELVEESAA